ncbi:MAG: LysM peptidoglycan-binding domain-containing protein [Chitinophagales bacterium]|nr:LysM peptidoglycan-binding domain-containing protein [Chitinophagales bacterium]
MTKTFPINNSTIVFLFAFCCTVLQNNITSAQLPLWIHTEEEVIPNQFESNDSLNEVVNTGQDNDPAQIDSLQEQKVSFANVDVPTYEDSIYRSRLAAIITPVELTYNDQVKKYIDLYVLNRRDQVSRMLGLSKLYFPIFDQIFTDYGVPMEMKYLSIIESALNPQAVSRMGATGIWQFMYATAKVYGLTINSYVDERKDIIRSTDGAARYLKNMYDVYGDWLLALASYNCGPGNVNRAITLSGGKTFWEIRDFLPRETRNYVPAFIAATYVMNYYELHELSPEFPKFCFDTITTVDINDRMASDQIAKFTGLSMDEFKFLNPGLKCSVIPGGSVCTYACKLPGNRISLFDEKKDSIILLSKNAKNTYYGGVATGSKTTHTVRRGENLGKIAAKYHVSVSQLKGWNNLHSSTIRTGQRLKISHHVSASVSQTSPPKKSSTVQKATVSAIDTLKEYVFYKARTGDTLWEIAQRHGTTVSAIRKLNGSAKCNFLKAGTVLKVSSKG